MVKLKVNKRISLNYEQHEDLGYILNLYIKEYIDGAWVTHYDEDTYTAKTRLTPETARKLAKHLEAVADQIEQDKLKTQSQAV
jgi:hypothetical protein